MRSLYTANREKPWLSATRKSPCRAKINKLIFKKLLKNEWAPPTRYMHAQSQVTLWDPVDCSPPGFSVHGDFPGKNNGVGYHFLLQRLFPTQELNPCLLHYRQTLYCGATGEPPPTRFYSLIFNSVCIDHLRLCLCFSQSTIKQIIFTTFQKRERLFTEVKGNMKWDEGAREWQL